MKQILLFILFSCTIKGYCQDTLKIHQIDSEVKAINQSDFKIQYDSIVQDYPDLGLSMRTYLTVVMDGNELKKYVNKVYSVRMEKGVSRQTTGANTFYFNQNKLIKVEEYMMEGDKEFHIDWFFSEDKPLYYTLKSDRAEDRANFYF